MIDVIERILSVKGHLGFYYKNMVTGEVMTYNKDSLFLAASEIKLPIFAVLMKQVNMGQIEMDERIKIKEEDKMPSCGALSSFTGEPEVDIRTLSELMITLSDNTATNVLINRLGMDTCNQIFSDIGFHKTSLNRLLFDSEAAERCIENYVCPVEFGNFFEKIYKRTFISEEVSKLMNNTLQRQQINHKIPGFITDDVAIAHKTGEDKGITHDCGIVYAKQPFIAVFMSNDTEVPQFEQIIREVSYDLYLDACR